MGSETTPDGGRKSVTDRTDRQGGLDNTFVKNVQQDGALPQDIKHERIGGAEKK